MKGRRAQLSSILKEAKLSGFERAVYKAVARIPAGEVRSYAWVAARAGRPLAFRAVGNALNKNPFTGLVPCHRVIRSDGSLGGFARGAAAKKRMLKAEGLTLPEGAAIIEGIRLRNQRSVA
ncbi:MAG: MGMT family protein [Candidatus Omnitrophica bacterium]|nr:MGMT family protein [Candidatus Omnitrophota bacterium]